MTDTTATTPATPLEALTNATSGAADATTIGVTLPVPADAGEVSVPRPRGRRGRLVLAILAVLLPVMAVGAAAGGLLAWDAGYGGKVLPGVHVGTVDLGGLDRDAAAAAIAGAYPYDGRLVVRTPDGDVAIPYASFGRHADTDALVDAAMASGRATTGIDRAVAQLRQAIDGSVIAPSSVFDRAALASAVTAAVSPLARDPLDATIAMGRTGPIVTPARAGRTIDPAPVVAAAIAAVSAADPHGEVVVTASPTAIAPAVDEEAVDLARSRAMRMVGEIPIAWGKQRWTIRATSVRSWIRFEKVADGSVGPVVDPTRVAASLSRIRKVVAQAPVSATFLRNRGGKPVGVVASKAGRAMDTARTVARIAAELESRAAGDSPGRVALAIAKVEPKLSTEDARKTAPLMVKLGSWTTWFPISDHNFFGANIWRPAQIIDGTVLAPGQTFDWWNAIWPVTTARGFGPGGVIRANHTDPTGALGGGMCSSSTTLFNAALRAGLRMGARSNHKYYIFRYPVGLDATVSIMGGGRQTMTFTNDTGHAIVIRAFKIRHGGRGFVRYEIWGVPDGRTVRISRPSLSNVRKAVTKTVMVTTLPHGVREQTEFPADGMDVVVTRIVRDARGRIVHRDVYRTHYVLWNGRIEVGV